MTSVPAARFGLIDVSSTRRVLDRCAVENPDFSSRRSSQRHRAGHDVSARNEAGPLEGGVVLLL
jgi:hypothetical protein